MKQLEIFENKIPTYSTWLSELNHERRQWNEQPLEDSFNARVKYKKLVAQGFFNQKPKPNENGSHLAAPILPHNARNVKEKNYIYFNKKG